MAGDKCKGHTITPATNSLFEVDQDSPVINEEDAQCFHSITEKLLFLAKRACRDILTTVALLTTRVKYPTIEDTIKLTRSIMYL